VSAPFKVKSAKAFEKGMCRYWEMKSASVISFCFGHVRTLYPHFDLSTILLVMPQDLFVVKQTFPCSDYVFSCVYDVFLLFV
jgi:hypothetical protein